MFIMLFFFEFFFVDGDIDDERIPLKTTPSFSYLDDDKKEVRFNTDFYETNLECKSFLF